ncbi:VPLPA-CTERM sorting domain-containing protein [Roseovarius sp. A-2]|uniref:VPLPA-CTERM sorting domain-containing protein n=1 Tax=Roseovarius sp. A-2 TaxID=1570360 RepID=UPI0009B57E06|nr:VPLPA-CTERM sorting domain-containing protein [Roseovarius sp. A-2]
MYTKNSPFFLSAQYIPSPRSLIASKIEPTTTGVADLLDLTDREIVIHGAFTNFALQDDIGDGLGGGILDDGEGNPTSAARNYNAGLPVLSGEISPVPLPAASLLLLTGIGGLGALRRFRKS